MDALKKHIISNQNPYISFSSRNKLTMNKLKHNNISNTNLKMISIINNKSKNFKNNSKNFLKTNSTLISKFIYLNNKAFNSGKLSRVFSYRKIHKITCNNSLKVSNKKIKKMKKNK